jgi:N-acetylglucosaminyl-diphospho-decaprenol L-rhamnosyltransferase
LKPSKQLLSGRRNRTLWIWRKSEPIGSRSRIELSCARLRSNARMLADVEVPIVIVGFGRSDDVVKCLSAIALQRCCPKFAVFICENGGPAAFDALERALSEAGGPCEGGVEHIEPPSDDFLRARRLGLAGTQTPVIIGQARDNSGFAGGTNAWVRPLLAEPGWTAVWILNPDTWPEPDALAELVDYAKKRGKGMVGSRLMIPGRSDIASSRGLKWNKLSARLTGVDIFAPVSPAPDPEDVERRMDSPTGPSMYVTRECIERIGLMDESFFLYWEEVDWAIRAKAACGIGYAHHSVVPHISGSSSGAVRDRAKRSSFSVYLSNRNQLHFVRRHYPRWFLWTLFVAFLRTGQYLAVGSTRNFAAAVKGLIAGLRGEKGRPKVAPDQAPV